MVCVYTPVMMFPEGLEVTADVLCGSSHQFPIVVRSAPCGVLQCAPYTDVLEPLIHWTRPRLNLLRSHSTPTRHLPGLPMSLQFRLPQSHSGSLIGVYTIWQYVLRVISRNHPGISGVVREVNLVAYN